MRVSRRAAKATKRNATCHLFRSSPVRGFGTARSRPQTTWRWQMYDFAVVALLALATLKLVDFLTDAVPQVQKMRSLLTFVIAVGATVLLDYSVFAAWGVDIRSATVGTWITGFIVAGLTVPWRAPFA